AGSCPCEERRLFRGRLLAASLGRSVVAGRLLADASLPLVGGLERLGTARHQTSLASSGALFLAFHPNRSGDCPALDDLRRLHPRASIWPVQPELHRVGAGVGARSL